jgi:three-Cys-motif partner protein
MSHDDFYEEQREQSFVKTEIVRKYFWAWAKVIVPQAKKVGKLIAYADLFCGPGRFVDGSESTPLQILRTALREPDLQEMLVTWFNDRNAKYIESLGAEIDALPEIGTLRNKPVLTSVAVGTDIVDRLRKSSMPTLFFVDPWGYNGLSLKMINSAIENWGCDCIFFFNYNRVNAALNNAVFRENMASLFGPTRAERLTNDLSPLSPADRELTIVEAISEGLNEPGARYVLPFRFKPTGKTSHHLIFVSKNILGYRIMKDIMWKGSSSAPDGMAAFEYNRATQEQPLLFQLAATLDDLGGILMDEFAGRTVTMREVYEEHNVGRPFVEANYKQALMALEAAGRVRADPPAIATPPQKSRRKGTFGPDVKVTFPAEHRR